MFGGADADGDVSIRKKKHGGDTDTTNVPNIEMYLSLACTQCPFLPFLSDYLVNAPLCPSCSHA